MNPDGNENEATFLWGCGSSLLGAALGAVVVSMAADYWYLLTDPAARLDGQYGLLFLNTPTLGGLLGAVSGFILPYLIRRSRSEARR